MRQIIYSATRSNDGYDHAVYDDGGDDMVHIVSVDAFNHAAEVPDIDCSYTMLRADAGPIGIALACAYAEPATPLTQINTRVQHDMYHVDGVGSISVWPKNVRNFLTLTFSTYEYGPVEAMITAADARALGLALLRAAAAADDVKK